MSHFSMATLTTGQTETEEAGAVEDIAGASLARDQVLAEAGEGLWAEQPPTDLNHWG